MIKDSLNSIMSEYASMQGMIEVDDIMKFAGDKSYFRAFVQFLIAKYPDRKQIIEGLLDIKSHGIGIVIPKQVIKKGLEKFPEGYLLENKLPEHNNLSFLNVIIPSHMNTIDTFPSLMYEKLKKYLTKNNANIVLRSYPSKDKIKKIHLMVEMDEMIKRRKTKQEYLQRIQDKRVPLVKELLETAYHAPSVLFEANKFSKKFVIAITESPGNHAEKDMEQNFCYFNNEAIFATEMVIKKKKVTILDLTANFSSGLTNLLLGKEDITLIGIHVNPEVDPTTFRNNYETQQNSYQFNLEAGANGEEYIEQLEKAVEIIPKETDILLIIGSVNNYLLDSEGLLCVEAEYQKEIGRTIGKKAKNIPKIIIEPCSGYEPESHLLFTDLCIGISMEVDKNDL